jgi:predicted RNA binding protein YcfA (HicA-like mRNA interferase family)
MRSADLLRRLERRATRLEIAHQEIEGKGSHVKVLHGGARTVIPRHGGELPMGTISRFCASLGWPRQIWRIECGMFIRLWLRSRLTA